MKTSTLVRHLLALVLATWLLAPAPAASAADAYTITIEAQTNSATSAQPRAGVEFTISLAAGIDPSTGSGRQRLALAREALPARVPAVGQVMTLAPTDEQGRTSLGGLAEGVYLIRESGLRSAAGELVADPTPFAPMLVALPWDLSNPAASGAVEVMPKPTPQTPSPSPRPSTTPTPVEPVPAVPPVPPVPGINSGGGAEFSGLRQWLTVLGGLALAVFAFSVTRRKDAAAHDGDSN